MTRCLAITFLLSAVVSARAQFLNMTRTYEQSVEIAENGTVVDSRSGSAPNGFDFRIDRTGANYTTTVRSWGIPRTLDATNFDSSSQILNIFSGSIGSMVVDLDARMHLTAEFDIDWAQDLVVTALLGTPSLGSEYHMNTGVDGFFPNAENDPELRYTFHLAPGHHVFEHYMYVHTTVTGSATINGGDMSQFTTQLVPEPASCLLLAGGLAAAVRRRKRGVRP